MKTKKTKDRQILGGTGAWGGKTRRTRVTKAQLQDQIEKLEEFLLDKDWAEMELMDLEKEYRKRYGKNYEY